jgi:hypothetical protein
MAQFHSHKNESCHEKSGPAEQLLNREKYPIEAVQAVGLL